MSAVAEGFVFRLSTAAQTDSFTAREIKWIPVHVVNSKIPFDTNGAVVADSDFRWHFFYRNRSRLRARAANCLLHAERAHEPAYNESTT